MTNKVKHLSQKKAGFTLVELLTVIAIIGLLAGILIPTIGAGMEKAKQARVKGQITQLANAIELFYSTYYHYPLSYAVDSSDIDIQINGKKPNSVENYITLPLCAKNKDMRKDRRFNRKGIPFYSLSEQEFNDRGHYIDAFGNSEFHILIDGDGDDAINISSIKRKKTKDTISGNKKFIRGRVHLYVYPEDTTMLNKQLITTWN